MNFITVKFDSDMKDLVLAGKKCCTTRLKPLGDIGDIFVVENRVFRILDIYRESHPCETRYFALEGFPSKREFIDRIEKIYPELAEESKKLVDLHTVYCHIFATVSTKCYSLAHFASAMDEHGFSTLRIEGFEFHYEDKNDS